ncbi:MAG: tetratricopeptide repeat protein [candidate division Zixibacteria bacterium]|nr:tetratricopeptide repeat protein [candidate division Zixibacteria bacterium]
MKKILILSILIIAIATTVYSLLPFRNVTTSSEKAYKHYNNGLDMGYRMFYRKAIDEFSRAVAEDPNFAMAHLMLGKYYDLISDFDSSERHIQLAHSLTAKVSEREKLVINYYYAELKDDSVGADSLLDILAQKHPDTVEPHELLAHKYMREGEHEKAIAQYEKILDIEPNHALAYNDLAYHYLSLGKYNDALAHSERYAFICPGQSNPLDTKGEILLHTGQYEKAIEQLEKSVEISPDFVFGWMHLAAAYAETGRLDDAETCWDKYLELTGTDDETTWAKRQKAGIEFRRGDFKKAKKLFTEVARGDSYRNDPGLNFELGLVNLKLGNIKSARKNLSIIEKAKEDPERNFQAEYYYHKLSAEIALLEKDFKRAEEHINAAISMISTPHGNVYNYAKLAEIQMNAGELVRARNSVNRALSINTNHPRSLNILYHLYSKQGEEAKAREIKGRYLQVMGNADPEHPEVERIKNG